MSGARVAETGSLAPRAHRRSRRVAVCRPPYGTYSPDRQSALDQLLVTPARDLPGERFCVAGSMFPASVSWPQNVERIEHLAPGDHRAFYNRQKFTLNLTRSQMIRTGYSPSVRLFDAAACGTPIITDNWPGLED